MYIYIYIYTYVWSTDTYIYIYIICLYDICIMFANSDCVKIRACSQKDLIYHIFGRKNGFKNHGIWDILFSDEPTWRTSPIFNWKFQSAERLTLW